MITLKRVDFDIDHPTSSDGCDLNRIIVSKPSIYLFGTKNETIKVWWNIDKPENGLDWIGLFDKNDSSFYLDQKSLRQHISPVIFTLTSRNLLNAEEVYFGLIDGMTGRMLAKSENIPICKSASLVFCELKKPSHLKVFINTNQGKKEILKSSRRNVTFEERTPSEKGKLLTKRREAYEFEFETDDLHISIVDKSNNNFDHFISANQLQNSFIQSKSYSHSYSIDLVFSIQPEVAKKSKNIMEIASSSSNASESPWKVYLDAKKRKFYVNHETKETRWTKPENVNFQMDLINNNPKTPDRTSSARSSFITPRRTITVRSDGCPKNDLIQFFQRDEFKSALYENEEAMRIYNECSVVRHALHRIQKDLDPPTKFENQPLFVRFANSFADVTQPLPSGWECIQMNQQTVFLNHSTKTTSFLDPRIRRFETKTARRGRSVPTRRSDGAKSKIDHALIGKCEDLRKIAQDNFPQIADRLSKKLMLIERFGGLAVASLANDLDITLALSMLEVNKKRQDAEEDDQNQIRSFYDALKRERLGKGPSRLCWKVSRERLLDDAFRVILGSDSFVLKKSRLHIRFEGELALDYGGLSREFFILLSRELFHPNNGYFEYDGNDYHLQLRPRGTVDTEKDKKWLILCGRVLALAIIHRCYIDVFFTTVFYKCLQKKPISLADFESSDLEFFKSMSWLLENNVDDLEMSFVYSCVVNGKVIELDLVTEGSLKAVNNENKAEFVELMCRKKAIRGVEKPLEVLLGAFHQVLNPELLSSLCPTELKRILSGSLELDLNDWRANTIYKGGYSDCHIVVEWFWEVIETMTNQERFDLLLFVTGSSSVPFEGFSALRGNDETSKFCIEKWGEATALPRAHTCFNRLQLPSYNTKQTLKAKLQQAIVNGMSYSIE